jgi:septal ring factor EnvC (AmiA/AmiB activator)
MVTKKIAALEAERDGFRLRIAEIDQEIVRLSEAAQRQRKCSHRNRQKMPARSGDQSLYRCHDCPHVWWE